jgi:hypothetical protein
MTFRIPQMAIWQALKSHIHGWQAAGVYIYTPAACHPVISLKTAILTIFQYRRKSEFLEQRLPM